MTQNTHSWSRTVGKGLMATAVVFWLWFGIGSATSEKLGLLNWLLHVLVPAGMFILSTLAALRWPGTGGTLLTLEGLLATAFVMRNLFQSRLSAATYVLMFLTLACPPLAAGMLFLLSRRRIRLAQG